MKQITQLIKAAQDILVETNKNVTHIKIPVMDMYALSNEAKEVYQNMNRAVEQVQVLSAIMDSHGMLTTVTDDKVRCMLIDHALCRKIVGQLMEYSMNEIEWNFHELTSQEQTIVGSQANLDKIRAFCQ